MLRVRRPADGRCSGGPADRCTFYHNWISPSGFGKEYYALGGPHGTVQNCVFYDEVSNAPVTYSLSTTDSIPAGGGNIRHTDPCFVDLTFADYRLSVSSPCIDAGDPTQSDPDGSRRDMGYRPFEPLTYCSALANSLGDVPIISSTGSARLTGPDDYHVTGNSIMPSQTAILIRGVGEASIPFYGRLLCVQGPIVPTDLMQADLDGHVDSFLSQAYLSSQGLMHLEKLYWQWWFRDPGDAFGVGLTGGLATVLRL